MTAVLTGVNKPFDGSAAATVKAKVAANDLVFGDTFDIPDLDGRVHVFHGEQPGLGKGGVSAAINLPGHRSVAGTARGAQLDGVAVMDLGLDAGDHLQRQPAEARYHRL